MIVLGGLDHLGIEIDTHHDVAEVVKAASHSTGPAAGVEDSRPSRHHRIDESSLTVEVGTLCGHPAEPLDVPLGVTRVLLDHLQPPIPGHAKSR